MRCSVACIKYRFPPLTITLHNLGMAVGGEQTYASVNPTILAVSSSEVTLSWPAPVDTGKSPITGYHVYMFDGIGLNSQADPQPVKHEIQVNPNLQQQAGRLRSGSCRTFPGTLRRSLENKGWLILGHKMLQLPSR